jgi:class 3 adenylate cyclase
MREGCAMVARRPHENDMNAMVEPGKPAENRTFVGSIVFIDIVDYSRKTVAEQILIRERFKGLMTASLAGIDPELRLVLDTGDGAAISFLGDLKDALTVSVRMRDYLRQANGAPVDEAAAANLNRTIPIFNYALRIGINLGPVKLQQDNHGHPQIVGDGINVAQRITSFARADQIVVSQSYFDAVSAVAPQYAKLLSYEGARTDKNVREHEIYVVGDADAIANIANIANLANTVGDASRDEKLAARATNVVSTNGKDSKSAATGHKLGRDDSSERKTKSSTSGSSGEKRVSRVVAPTPFMQDRNKLLLTGSILAFVVAGLFAFMTIRKPSTKALPKYENVTEEVASTSSKPAPAEATPATRSVAANVPDAPAQPINTVPAAPAAVAPPVVENLPVEVAKSAAKPVVKPVVAQGIITFSIQPWGDVYVNGRSVGASPPLKQSKLAPGRYRVEVKNTTFSSYVTTVEVTSKETVSVKHRFQ